MILLELFWSFLQIGLFSIGGGYAAIPLIQSQAVETHAWLSAEQFLDLATIAEMTPGPIGINAATFVGMRISGLPGALMASLGFVFPSLVIVSALSVCYMRYREMPLLKSVLSSLRPAVVALIAAAGLNMLLQVAFGGRDNFAMENIRWAGAALFAGAFFLLRKYKWNPIQTIALCGAAGLVLGLFGIF
ncbi:MAG: chromate transporter [Clostridia bacterium]|nr:chromate transporter [Clostridia bacterium]